MMERDQFSEYVELLKTPKSSTLCSAMMDLHGLWTTPTDRPPEEVPEIPRTMLLSWDGRASKTNVWDYGICDIAWIRNLSEKELEQQNERIGDARIE